MKFVNCTFYSNNNNNESLHNLIKYILELKEVMQDERQTPYLDKDGRWALNRILDGIKMKIEEEIMNNDKSNSPTKR